MLLLERAVKDTPCWANCSRYCVLPAARIFLAVVRRAGSSLRGMTSLTLRVTQSESLMFQSLEDTVAEQRRIKLETREVHIAEIRVNPDGAWMKQVARNLTGPVDGFLRDATHLIHDADPLFTADFKAILKPASYADNEGVACVKIPPRSPNCTTAVVFQWELAKLQTWQRGRPKVAAVHPHAERFVKTIKYECLRHFVFFG